MSAGLLRMAGLDALDVDAQTDGRECPQANLADHGVKVGTHRIEQIGKEFGWCAGRIADSRLRRTPGTICRWLRSERTHGARSGNAGAGWRVIRWRPENGVLNHSRRADHGCAHGYRKLLRRSLHPRTRGTQRFAPGYSSRMRRRDPRSSAACAALPSQWRSARKHQNVEST